MGVVGSKSPLERRNTVLRRSQRKSIHGVKSKADKLAKDIKKFKGTEENSDYIELKAKIETMERELKHHMKNLQPQIQLIYNEAFKRTQECHQLLTDKLKENQDKLRETQEKMKEVETKHQEKEEDGDDDVFAEEINEEGDGKATLERKTVEMKVVQVERITESPQYNRRISAMKIGVPVMPGSMLESLNRKSEEMNQKAEEKIARIRKEIEKLEEEISRFVGRKNGKYYSKIRFQLETYSDDLKTVSSKDEDIQEQAKLCSNYIGSCLSFLDEKAVDDGGYDDEDDESEEEEEVKHINTAPDTNLSPRSIRTTYI